MNFSLLCNHRSQLVRQAGVEIKSPSSSLIRMVMCFFSKYCPKIFVLGDLQISLAELTSVNTEFDENDFRAGQISVEGLDFRSAVTDDSSSWERNQKN